MRLRDYNKAAMRATEEKTPENIETRQQVRWSLTKIIFGQLWEKYRMPRKVMRKMARDMMHKQYKETEYAKAVASRPKAKDS